MKLNFSNFFYEHTDGQALLLKYLRCLKMKKADHDIVQQWTVHIIIAFTHNCLKMGLGTLQ